MSNEELTLAKEWFESIGISARIVDGDLYIYVVFCEVMVSSSEVSYRADLRKEEMSTQQD